MQVWQINTFKKCEICHLAAPCTWNKTVTFKTPTIKQLLTEKIEKRFSRTGSSNWASILVRLFYSCLLKKTLFLYELLGVLVG